MKKHVNFKFLHGLLILLICSCSQQIFPGINDPNQKEEETENQIEEVIQTEEDNRSDEEVPVVIEETPSEEETTVVQEEVVEIKSEDITVIREIKETVLKELTTQETTNNITSENSYNYYGCDELLNLDEVSIVAKAYPGVNIVTWKPVKGANSYILYKYEEDFPAGVYTFNHDDLLILYDTAITDETNYTYVVEAESKSSPSRAVFVQNTTVETSVKAIVPPSFVNARGLCGYEDGYNGEIKELGFDEGIIDCDNIITSWESNHLTFSFPTKAYLSYTVYAFRGNEYTLSKDWKNTGIFLGNYRSFINNKIVNGSAKLVMPGTYTIGVVVSSLSNVYGESELVESDNKIVIPVVKLKQSTSELSGNYVDEGKTVRIKWLPAVLEDDSNPPVSCYSVYSYDKAENNYLRVGSVKSDGTYYYSILDVENSKITNSYFIGLNVNGAFEFGDNVVTVEPYVVLEDGILPEITAPEISIVETENSISATVSFLIDLRENQTIDCLNYAAVDKDITEESVLGTDFTEFLDFQTSEVHDETDYQNYKISIKNLPIGKKLAVYIEFKEPGRKNAVTYFVSEEITFTIPECTFDVAKYNSNKARILILEDKEHKKYSDNYRYDVYYAKTVETEEDKHYISQDTEWVTLRSGSMEFSGTNLSGSFWECVTEYLEYGTYVFRFEKSWANHPEVEPYTSTVYWTTN